MNLRTLLPYQIRWVQNPDPLKVVEKSRRIGLTWAEAYDDVMHAASGAGNVYYQSYAQDMTAGYIQDCAEWAKHIGRLTSAIEEGTFLDGGKEIRTYSIRLTSGKVIESLSASPRQFRSKGRPGDIAVVDEAAFIDDLDEVLKAALAFLMWGGQVRVLSTHNGEGNAFNKLCRAIERGKQPGSLHTITFDDAIADGLPERVLEVLGRPVTPEAVAAWIKSVRDFYRHNAGEELDCAPAAGAGSFLTWDMIRACQHADAGKPELYTGNRSYLAIDVARRAHLWVCTALEPVGDVLWVREMKVLQNKKFSEQRAEVRRMKKQYRAVRIGVDQTGIGENFFEDLQEEHGAHTVEGYLFSVSTKLALATSLLEKMEDKLIRIPDDDDTEADLHSVKRQSGAGTAPRLVADGKDTDGHADRFWSLAMACMISEAGIGAFEGATTETMSAVHSANYTLEGGPDARGRGRRIDYETGVIPSVMSEMGDW